MRYFSTFSGIGGFELGIQNAYRETIRRKQTDTSRNDEEGQGLVATQGQDTSTTDGRAGECLADLLDERPLCVGYSEIDKYATKVYEKHFKGVKNYGDITKINAEELPDFDCLVGGFPCQAFSIAGKRRGFEDTRGTLFFDLARILRAKRPPLFVFENVKGLLSHDNGNTFRTIISTITELGYDAQWQVLNSKNFGVPQNRERVIIVGYLRGTPRPEVFPLGATDEKDTRIVGQDVAYTIDANYAKGTNTLEKSRRSVVGTLRTHKDSNGFREMKSGLFPTILARSREDGSGQPVVKIVQRERGKNKGGEHYVAPTISSHSWQDNNHLMEDFAIRRLTPLECERLQGFPDNWTKEGIIWDEYIRINYDTTARAFHLVDISDAQRYKMCGNAVTTNVIQAVFERIFTTCVYQS